MSTTLPCFEPDPVNHDVGYADHGHFHFGDGDDGDGGDDDDDRDDGDDGNDGDDGDGGRDGGIGIKADDGYLPGGSNHSLDFYP